MIILKLKIGVVSLGCDKNLVDTEYILAKISEKYEICSNPKIADIIIINTCAFIESATKESINTILEMADFKNEGICKKIIVVGCLAERYKELVLQEMPEVDAVVGIEDYDRIIEVIESKERILRINSKVGECNFTDRILTTPSYTAYLKIAEGCNNHCTYCTIPKIRGNYRSRKMEDVLKEANNLVQKGVKELIIVAQDTTKYGIDKYDKPMLVELLKNLEKIEGLKWIRLMYCYPEGITEELINEIKNNSKVCKYMDMPIQHINDDILKLMGRRTTKEQIVGLINKLRKQIPEIVIRTTLIVGFPGETNKEFNELIDFLSIYKLNKVGAFQYSKEEGTAAAKLKGQVSTKVKRERFDKLMKLQQEISYSLNKQLINNKIEVLIEESINNNFYLGRTSKDAPQVDGQVYLLSNNKLKSGDFVNAKITDVKEYDLIGEIINESSK